MVLQFTLSMPNVGSWNGKWSGENNLFAKVHNFGRSKVSEEKANKILSKEYFYYNFRDGWGAEVKVSLIDAKKATKVRKASQGFCGYDWMVDSIIKDLEIKTNS